MADTPQYELSIGVEITMAMPAFEQNRFRLPTRIRTRLGLETAYPAHFELADRIAELPYVRTVEDALDVLPSTVAVFLQPDTSPARKRQAAVLFCRINNAGISVEGLTDTERHHVLSRGWGKLENRRIRLLLPRDDGELAVCWDILCRAYRSIINSPACLLTVPTASVTELPEYSRTSLC